MSNVADQILDDIMRGGAQQDFNVMPRHLRVPEFPQAQPFPRNPLNVMPRHLNVPNVGGSVPLRGTPVSVTPRGVPSTAANASRLAQLARGAGQSVGGSPVGRSLQSGLLSNKFVRGGARRLASSGFVRGGALGIGADLAGTALGNMVAGDAEDTSGFDRADLGEAVTGGFRGAAAGKMFGGNYGAAAGAVLGAGMGALDVIGSLFGGGDEKPPGLKDPDKALDNALTVAGLNDATERAIKEGTMAQLELATTDAEKQDILQNAVATIQNERLRAQQEQQQLVHSLALQAQTAEVFQPFAEANQRNADLARVLYADAAENLPPAQRHLAAQFALGAQQQSDALTQNLFTTAQARPRVDALVQQQRQIDSMAQQIVQRAMQAQMPGAGGGVGGVDVNALLQEAGAL